MQQPPTWSEKVQRRLIQIGFDPGPIDGIIGKRTRRALRQCADWHNAVAGSLAVDPMLWPDGIISDRTELSAPAIKSPWPKERDVLTFFGDMGYNLKRLELPYPMRLSWSPSETIDSFMIHEKVHDSASHCFNQIAEKFSMQERHHLGIDVFSGCLSEPRLKRGGSTWSMHSWGIAIDFDDRRNPLRAGRDTARLGQPDAEPFWEIWEKEGWISLGRTKNYDWMHVQAAQLN